MWKRALWSVLVAGLAAAHWIAWQAPAAGTFHDDGVYLVTAKSLAEGKGYRIISLPAEIPQTKYPILFPLALAAAWKINPAFPNNVPLLKSIPLLFALIWLALVFRLAREQGAGTGTSAAVCMLTAASPWAIYLSSAVLSETMFAAALTASLLFLMRAMRQDGAALRRNILLSALFAAAAFHTRSIGLAMVVAGPVSLWLRGRRRQAVMFALTAALACAPWAVWTAINGGQMPATDAYYSKENYQGWNILFNFGLGQKVHIAFQNMLMLLLSPAMIYGWPMKGAWLLPAGAAGVWLARCAVKQSWSAANVLMTVYLSMVVCWAWAPTRFLIPILPLLLLPAAIEFQKMRIRWQPLALAAIIGGTALAVVSASGKTLRLGDAMPTLAESDAFTSLTSQLEWVRQNTDPSAVLAGNLDPLYYLYTGRKAVRGFAAEPYSLIYDEGATPIGGVADALRNLCASRATYWIESPNSSFLEGKYLTAIQSEAYQRAPNTLQKVFDRMGTHRIYGVRCEERMDAGLQQQESRVHPEPSLRKSAGANYGDLSNTNGQHSNFNEAGPGLH